MVHLVGSHIVTCLSWPVSLRWHCGYTPCNPTLPGRIPARPRTKHRECRLISCCGACAARLRSHNSFDQYKDPSTPGRQSIAHPKVTEHSLETKHPHHKMTVTAERAMSAMLTPERATSALAKDIPHVDNPDRVCGLLLPPSLLHAILDLILVPAFQHSPNVQWHHV